MSWIPGHLDDALLPGAGLHHVQPEQLFQLVALQASVQGHLRFKKKKVHLMVHYSFLSSFTWKSSFEYLATTPNKQTCCHLWYSSSCPSIVVSLTLTDAVECECQLSFELFINLACCTSFTSQGVNFGAECPLSSCDGWENLAQLSDALCCNHQKIKKTFFAC